MPFYSTCSATKPDGEQCSGPAQEFGRCRHHLLEGEEREVAIEVQKLDEEKAANPDPDIDFEVAKERRLKHRREMAASGALPNQKLVAPRREGYVRRWVNDDGTRLEDLQDKGYSFVEDTTSGDPDILSSDLGNRKSQIVGRKADGSPLTAYLMEQPSPFHEEDSQEKEARRHEVERQIKKGAVSADGNPINQPGTQTYDPQRGGPNQLDPG